MQYTNGTWRADTPGAMQNTNFEAFIFSNGTVDACYLDASLGFPCLQGSIPPIGVDARTVSDVQAAVKFAKRFNLRLVIKNTGHDYLGRSAGRGAFMLWTHYLKEMTYDASFTPLGASSENSHSTFKAVTFGAGIQWAEAYAFVQEHNQTVVGGISLGGSVGAAGGWVMGGGHSAMSPSLGLGIDNVLQFSVVLSDGS
ncbi:putative FAD-linked oxidoreductase [Psilocybe cubensis]|uniref:FAD-linked oxidoreductase n=1 Tax=Psilocybe cubensis TaxID=181762 RepID=A0ACB8GR17_PSICU|nr:putative FAD-linked oxidoreductase [Psilocybe cubensis]KAH9478073.1 putative FAD-linked oxidoreductase [Psilocybe cubensis]